MDGFGTVLPPDRLGSGAVHVAHRYAPGILRHRLQELLPTSADSYEAQTDSVVGSRAVRLGEDVGGDQGGHCECGRCREETATGDGGQYLSLSNAGPGGKPNTYGWELYLHTCRDGRHQQWSLVPSAFVGKPLDYILVPLVRETDLPVVRLQQHRDVRLNWTETEAPYLEAGSPETCRDRSFAALMQIDPSAKEEPPP